MLIKKNIYSRYHQQIVDLIVSLMTILLHRILTLKILRPASWFHDKSICFMEQILYFLLPYILFWSVKAYFSWVKQNMWSYFSCGKKNVFFELIFQLYISGKHQAIFIKKKIKKFIPNKKFYAPDVLLLLLAQERKSIFYGSFIYE